MGNRIGDGGANSRVEGADNAHTKATPRSLKYSSIDTDR